MCCSEQGFSTLVVCRHDHRLCEEHYTYLDGKAGTTQVRSINQHLKHQVLTYCVVPGSAHMGLPVCAASPRLSLDLRLLYKPSLALGVGKHVDRDSSRTYFQGFLKENVPIP